MQEVPNLKSYTKMFKMMLQACWGYQLSETKPARPYRYSNIKISEVKSVVFHKCLQKVFRPVSLSHCLTKHSLNSGIKGFCAPVIILPIQQPNGFWRISSSSQEKSQVCQQFACPTSQKETLKGPSLCTHINSLSLFASKESPFAWTSVTLSPSPLLLYTAVKVFLIEFKSWRDFLKAKKKLDPPSTT